MSVDVRARTPASVAGAIARSIRRWPRLALDRRLSQPRRHLGASLNFADGTTQVVFRETVLSGVALTDPCVLIVQFRLRLLGRARLPHALFRAGCVINTPLFAGFEGFATKLWLADIQTGEYRGVYDWNGAQAAVGYAEPLCALLRVFSVPGSVRYHVVEATTREAFLNTATGATFDEYDGAWWRLRHPVVMADRES